MKPKTDNTKLIASYFAAAFGVLQIVDIVIAIKATIEEITPSMGKDFPISNPRTITAPVKPNKTPNH